MQRYHGFFYYLTSTPRGWIAEITDRPGQLVKKTPPSPTKELATSTAKIFIDDHLDQLDQQYEQETCNITYDHRVVPVRQGIEITEPTSAWYLCTVKDDPKHDERCRAIIEKMRDRGHPLSNDHASRHALADYFYTGNSNLLVTWEPHAKAFTEIANSLWI